MKYIKRPIKTFVVDVIRMGKPIFKNNEINQLRLLVKYEVMIYRRMELLSAIMKL